MTTRRQLRVSQVLGRQVEDRDGRPLGTVLDLRVVQDGPAGPSGNAALRIDALIVGPSETTDRWGLFRHTVRGPWLLRAIDQLLGPHRAFIDWTDLDPATLVTDEPLRTRNASPAR